MTHILAINGHHHGRATAALLAVAASAGAAVRVAGPFVLTWRGRLSANKYVRLAAFGVFWTLMTMILVNFSFDLAFNQQPYPFFTAFTATH